MESRFTQLAFVATVVTTVTVAVIAMMAAAAAATPIPTPQNTPTAALVGNDDWPAPDFETVARLDELTERHATLFRLYEAFFLRLPDPVGALYWIDRVDRCGQLTTIADQFSQGEEFVNLYGPLNDRAFVKQIYSNVLGRAGDKAGLAYWTERVTSGRISRGEMVLWVSKSQEFRRANPFPSDGVPARRCRPANTEPTPRTITMVGTEVMATVGSLRIMAPAAAIERVGFHQSTHPGALAMTSADPSFPISTMDSRYRGTAATGAADVVVHPSVPITAPVSGTVKRAGGYTLYCRYSDGYVVIAPDERPELELKVLHMQNVSVSAGQRVEAGDRIGGHATPFPFNSQIDELTAEPSWPHVHVELVDPSIPRRSSSGSC